MKKYARVIYPFEAEGYYNDEICGYDFSDIDELYMRGYRTFAVLDAFDHAYLYSIEIH